MDLLPHIAEISQKTPTKIVLVVLDGLGGLPREMGGSSELMAARTPNLDALTQESALGLLTMVAPGFTPGSGPGHLSLFGYQPFNYQVGRGALSAIGIGAALGPGDVAIRGNFATLDDKGLVVDRRAGRPTTDENRRVIQKLQATLQTIEDVKVELYTESEHRFVVVLRGQGLGDMVHDTDPQKTGVSGLEARPEDSSDKASEKTARILNALTRHCRYVLGDEPVVNGVLFRGISARPSFPAMKDIYKLTPACLASFPMYKGVASLVGMEVLEIDGENDAVGEKLESLRQNWERFDFFFLHFKKTDSAGEDGDFDKKSKKIEVFDAILPEILALKPDVLAITGDHSTPSVLGSHSWHPVPVLLKAPYLRNDPTERFTEDEALKGSLGQLKGWELMPLLLAHAGKLQKFGA